MTDITLTLINGMQMSIDSRRDDYREDDREVSFTVAVKATADGVKPIRCSISRDHILMIHRVTVER